MTLLALLLGCAPEADGPGLSDPERQGGCTLYVPEQAVDFGDVRVREGSVEQVFRFRNDGDAECILTQVSLQGGHQDFDVRYDNPYPVAPSQVGEILLSYTPAENGSDLAELLIVSNDAQQPRLEIPLQGVGQAPSLALALQDEQEPAYLGCVQERVLVLLNQGDDVLRVDQVDLAMGPDFAWTEEAELLRAQLPLELEPGESLLLGLRFEPRALDGAQEGAVEVRSSDPEQALRVLPIKGSAQAYAEHLQSLERPLQPKTDVLIVLDWSDGEDEIRAMSAAFPTFRSTLEGENLDYHLSVVVEDTGCLVGGQGPIHKGLSAEQQLERFETQSCTTPQGTADCMGIGRYLKSAFTLASNATSPENTAAGGCNQNVCRDDAELHIISLSRNAEQSLDSTAVHLARLQALREDPSDVVLHGLGGPPPSGCQDADYYDRYHQATELSGGVFRDICDVDMETHVEAFASAVVPSLGAVDLDAHPIPETVEVRVDGVVVEGWSLDLLDNTLRFDSEPAPGSEIEIRYASAPAECEPAR